MNRHSNNIHVVGKIADRIARGNRDFGRVSAKEDGDYLLLNYTNEAQFGGNLTRTEEACRGLVIRKDGKVMALPFNKFYNLGEPSCPNLPMEPYTVWEKVDGSLGIFWYEHSNDPAVPSRWRCNTRGSFSNQYTDFAIDWWNRNVSAIGIPHSYTVLVEICLDDDEMPRAVEKSEGLYLLACRDRETGRDIPIEEIEIKGLLPIGKVDKTIDELLNEREGMEGTEGWVVRFDSGFRIKIKTAWYLRLFRAVQQLTFKHIRELMIDNYPSIRWLDDFPDDLIPEAGRIRDTILRLHRRKVTEIYAAYDRVKRIESRKDFAIAVIDDYRDISSWLFKMRDGRFREVEVLQKMELAEGES